MKKISLRKMNLAFASRTNDDKCTLVRDEYYKILYFQVLSLRLKKRVSRKK